MLTLINKKEGFDLSTWLTKSQGFLVRCLVLEYSPAACSLRLSDTLRSV